METKMIDILCVNEARWKGSSTREIRNGFKLYYRGSQEGRNGVGVIVRNKWKEKIVEVKKVNDMIWKLPVIVGD